MSPSFEGRLTAVSLQDLWPLLFDAVRQPNQFQGYPPFALQSRNPAQQSTLFERVKQMVRIPSQLLPSQLLPSPPLPSQSDRLLITAEVAAFFHCNAETVKRRARCGKLPAFKFGKLWLFRPADIGKTILQGRQSYSAIGAANRPFRPRPCPLLSAAVRPWTGTNEVTSC